MLSFKSWPLPLLLENILMCPLDNTTDCVSRAEPALHEHTGKLRDAALGKLAIMGRFMGTDA